MREDGNRRGEKPDTSGWEAMPLCLPLLLIQACVSRSFSQNRCSLHFSSLPYSYPSRSTSLSHTQANSIGKPKNPKQSLELVAFALLGFFFYFFIFIFPITHRAERLVKDMGRRALWKWVHRYGKITTVESWDSVVDEETYYEAEPHYGWAYVVGDSSQLLSIKPRERPPGGYPALDFGSLSPSVDEPPDEFSPISCGSKNFVNL
ncbi:uncharacterized protein [Malus domestica]|uniref:uncharacterized protein isoform X6 n=1 Tax=Malus domestica TaxID=3750 RepID=UPI003976FC61